MSICTHAYVFNNIFVKNVHFTNEVELYGRMPVIFIEKTNDFLYFCTILTEHTCTFIVIKHF